MGIASLILGIISILTTLVTGGGYGWLGVIFGIIGIVLGALGRKEPEAQGVATAGMVCSIVGTILGIILYLVCLACIGVTASSLNNIRF